MNVNVFNYVDAVSALGNGNVLWQGGGAASASDKVVQHNGRGTVTIKDTTFVNVGKVYRSCGDCTNNGGPRNVVISNIKVNGVSSDLVGINSNYGDNATIKNACYDTKTPCQMYNGCAGGCEPTKSGTCSG